MAARRVAFWLLVALVLAGCGDRAEAEELLAETTDRLGEIRSGDLELALVAAPKGTGEDTGFELRGPFALAGPGSLPRMRLQYTEIADGRRRMMTVVSTGTRAFIEVGGRPYALPPERVEELREAVRELDEAGGLQQLRMEDWAEDPELAGRRTTGSTVTEHIVARLNVAEAADDLLDLARPFEALGLERVLRDADFVRRAARSGTIDVYTGEKDRLLRKLRMEVDVGLDVPGVLRDTLGAVVGANVTLELEVSRPNRRVVVREPTRPPPDSALVPSSSS